MSLGLVKTYDFPTLGGGVNLSPDASKIAPDEMADIANFYPYGTVLRRRGGIKRLTPVPWGSPILGMQRLVKSNTAHFMIVATKDKFGRLVDDRIENLIMLTTLGTNTTSDRWCTFQYKDFVYGLRKSAGRMVRVDGYGAARAGIDAPTGAPTSIDDSSVSGTLPAGTYKTVYTYGNAASGYESLPSPPSTVAITGANGMTHSNPNLPNDPFVDTINVYRSLVDQDNGVYFFVGTMGIIAGVMALGEAVTVTNMGRLINYNLDLPPSDLLYGDVWNERLFATDAINVFYSEILNVEGFNLTESIISVYPDDGFEIRGMKAFGDRFIVGKTNRMYYLTGKDKRDFKRHILSDKHGVRSQWSMQVAEDKLFWYGSGKSIFASDGTNVFEISDPKVKPLLELITDDQEERLVAWVDNKRGWYVLALPAEESLVDFETRYPDRKYLVWDYRQEKWTIFTVPQVLYRKTFGGEAYTDDEDQVIFLADEQGYLYHFNRTDWKWDDETIFGDQGNEPVSSPIECSFTLPADDFGFPGKQKRISRIAIQVPGLVDGYPVSGASPMSLFVMYDGDVVGATRSLTMFDDGDWKAFKLDKHDTGGRRGQTIQLKFNYQGLPVVDIRSIQVGVTILPRTQRLL
jgi:hypothetical protein